MKWAIFCEWYHRTEAVHVLTADEWMDKAELTILFNMNFYLINEYTYTTHKYVICVCIGITNHHQSEIAKLNMYVIADYTKFFVYQNQIEKKSPQLCSVHKLPAKSVCENLNETTTTTTTTNSDWPFQKCFQ